MKILKDKLAICGLSITPGMFCYSCCSCLSTILLELAYSLPYINFLRYNSHTTQFTHLKCTVPWFSVYSEVCNHRHNFSTSSSLTKEISMNEELFPNHYKQILHLSAMTNLLSVSIYLPILGISCTWDYTMLGHLTHFFHLAQYFQGLFML